MLGATAATNPSLANGGASKRRESSLVIHTLPSTRALSHPYEGSSVNLFSSSAPKGARSRCQAHKTSCQNTLATSPACYGKESNSPRSPKSGTFSLSPNATPPTSKTSSTFQIISNALDAVVNLPYKLAGDNISTKTEPWSPSERKRQSACRSTVYYSPDTGEDLPKRSPSRPSSNFDFVNVRTQPVVVVYNPSINAFVALDAQQSFPGQCCHSYITTTLYSILESTSSCFRKCLSYAQDPLGGKCSSQRTPCLFQIL